MTEAQIIQLDGFGPVEVRDTDDGGVTLISQELQTWLVELVPAAALTDDLTRTAPPAPAGVAIAEAFAAAIPGIGSGLGRGGDLVVRFAPALRQGLADGSLRLMATGASSLPTAISTTSGQIAGTATVVGAAGGTAAIGTAALPLLLAGGAAFAATWAQQRWLEKTFAGFQSSLERIETRLRDSDLGVLDAAERLLHLIGPDTLTGDIPAQLRLELAAAHHQVDAVYCARLRFLERFRADLDRWQEKAIKEDGRRVAWTADVVKALSDDRDPTTSELVLFFHALITRARTTAATAAVLAADGHPSAAIRLIDELQSSIRRDYFDTHNRLRALAREPIDTARWKKLLPGTDGATGLRAYDTIKLLAGNLDQAIGQHLPDPDTVLELPVGSIRAA